MSNEQNWPNAAVLRPIIERLCDNKLQELAIKYIMGTTTLEEDEELKASFKTLEEKEVVEKLANKKYLTEQYQQIVAVDTQSAWEKLKELAFPLPPLDLPTPPVVPLKSVWYKRYSVRVAAAVLVLVACVWLFKGVFSHDHAGEVVLTLANGKQEFITDGLVVKQGNVEIRKEEGQLVYKELQAPPPGAVLQFNSLKVPLGSNLKVVLTDGSMVWVSPGSTIRYPCSFIEKERHIELTGEAYFEVKHDAARSFKVLARDAEVSVLGTQFNVSAYSDDTTLKTTLYQGSVVLSSRAPVLKKFRPVMLKPGSQAVINYLDAGSQDSTVHVFENFASKWKENEFDFHNENITGMMKQIGRYYNKQIIYEGKPGDGKYTAIISHDKDIDSLIQKLKIYKIHVKNEGDKLIVTP